MRKWEKNRTKTIEGIDEFIKCEDISVIYREEMYRAFLDYSKSKRDKKIIMQEALISYLSDLSIRDKKFRRELSMIYNKSRKDFVENITNKHLIYNLIEEKTIEALDIIITEKEHIYNVIDDKRQLFG